MAKFYLLDRQEEQINAVVIALPSSEKHPWHRHWCPTCRRWWEHPGNANFCASDEQYDCPACAGRKLK